MNLSNLSADEVLRICNPETELEKRLFSICTNIEQDLKDIKSENRDLSQVIENYTCENCSEIDRQIESAISMIESGRIDEAVRMLNSI